MISQKTSQIKEIRLKTIQATEIIAKKVKRKRNIIFNF